MDDEIQAIQDQIETLKKQLSEARRRRSPEPVENYTFRGPDDAPVTLLQLFGDRDDLLVIHNMGKGCSHCTLWADGFSGLLPHLQDRAAFAVASPDDPATQVEFATGRGWTFPMVSTRGSDFSAAMGFEKNGDPWPGVSAFRRNPDDSIVRTGSDSFGSGDDYSPPWRLFDLLADGVNGWHPKYNYSESSS